MSEPEEIKCPCDMQGTSECSPLDCIVFEECHADDDTFCYYKLSTIKAAMIRVGCPEILIRRIVKELSNG